MKSDDLSVERLDFIYTKLTELQAILNEVPDLVDRLIIVKILLLSEEEMFKSIADMKDKGNLH